MIRKSNKLDHLLFVDKYLEMLTFAYRISGQVHFGKSHKVKESLQFEYKKKENVQNNVQYEPTIKSYTFVLKLYI